MGMARQLRHVHAKRKARSIPKSHEGFPKQDFIMVLSQYLLICYLTLTLPHLHKRLSFWGKGLFCLFIQQSTYRNLMDIVTQKTLDKYSLME
jgi:hypothetical protein